jgi:hypothetical protein
VHVAVVGAKAVGPLPSIDSDASYRLSLIGAPILKQPVLALNACLPCLQFNGFYYAVSPCHCTKWNYLQTGRGEAAAMLNRPAGT